MADTTTSLKLSSELKERVRKLAEARDRSSHYVMREAIEQDGNGTAGIHASFDIDGIDPRYAPGVSTPVSGGLTWRESHLCLEMIYETKKLVGMDLVELNPVADINAQSANVVVDLILSGLGKSIV